MRFVAFFWKVSNWRDTQKREYQLLHSTQEPRCPELEQTCVISEKVAPPEY